MSYLISTGRRSFVSLDHAILGFLSEHPRSGYDLKNRCFDEGLASLWPADQAQVYRTLDRLLRGGLVSVKRRRHAGRPDRKIYEITYAGGEALATWLTRPTALPPYRDPFLVQLHFGSALEDDRLLEVMCARRSEHQARLDELRLHAAHIAEDHRLPARTMILRQTALDGAIARERSAIDWLDDCIEATRQGALPGSKADTTGQRHLFGS